MQGASSNSITIQFLLQSTYDCTSNVSIICVIQDGQPHSSELREKLPHAQQLLRGPHALLSRIRDRTHPYQYDEDDEDDEDNDVRVIEIHKYTENNSTWWDFTKQQGYADDILVTRQLIQDDIYPDRYPQSIQKIHNFFEYEWQKSVWRICNIVFVCIKGGDHANNYAKKEAKDFVGKIALAGHDAQIANYSPNLGWIVMIAHPEA